MVAGSYRRSRDVSERPALGRVSRGPACLGQVPVPGTWTCPAVPWSGDLGVEIVVAADLLVPPLGLAALQRALSLGDVRRELVLLRVELLLAVVELLGALTQACFGIGQPLLALADSGEGRLGDLGLLHERGFTLVELLLAGLELLPQGLP